MKIKKVITILGFLFLFLSGCKEHKTNDSSKIPWARPTSWENNTPKIGAGISY